MKKPAFLLLVLAAAIASCDLGRGTVSAREPSVPDPSPQRFAKSIEAFAAKDKQAPPKPGVILFVGSSSIRLWNLDKHFPGLDAINRGFGGSHISDVNHYAEHVIWKYQPSKVVFFCGTNDLWHGKPPEQVAEDFAHFRQQLFEHVPDATLIYLAIKPSPQRRRVLAKVRATNALLREQVKDDKRIIFLDGAFDLLLDADGAIRGELYQDDQLHLNADGYRVWTKMLAPYVELDRKTRLKRND